MAQTNNVNLRMLVMEMLLTEDVYSHVLIRGVLDKYNYLTQREKSFMKRLYEGTLERRIELDYVIGRYSSVRTDAMKPVIRALLRMGAYQILYMDAVPDAAACNEAVKLAQKKGFSALKGFVNGVLRNIARNKGAVTYTSLSVEYSMPGWIVDMWTRQLGVEKARLVLKGLLGERPVTVRFRKAAHLAGDSMAAAVEAVAEAVAGQGGRMERHPYLPYAYQISKTDDITRLPYYQDGAFVVQDVSSMLAVEAVASGSMGLCGRTGPLRVVDLCAAPGGKSMLAADLLEGCGVEYTVVSGDISEGRTALMQENFDRCGLKHATAAVWDARQKNERLAGAADIVIADVPCSGLGVIGRKRDIKYRVTPEAVRSIIALQEQILEAAAFCLKPGGRLLFATCTINQDENEKHFEWLKEQKGLIPMPLDGALPECLHSDTTKKGYLQLLPGIHDTDGFFISVFTKPLGQ